MSDDTQWRVHVENLLRQIETLQVPVKNPQQAKEREAARAALAKANGDA